MPRLQRPGRHAATAFGLTLTLTASAGWAGAPAPGALHARLQVGAPHVDVQATRFRVVPAGASCAEPPVAQQVAPRSAPVAAFALPPGAYRVCAYPLADEGLPSADCAPAQRVFTVPASGFARAELRTACDGEVGVNQAPEFPAAPPTEHRLTCRELAFDARAVDPEGDAVTYRWAVTERPAEGRFSVRAEGPRATFFSPDAGRYALTVVARDEFGAEARHTVRVTARDCAVPAGLVLDPRSGHAYGLTAPLDHAGARAAARDAGGDLASLDDAVEHAFVARHFAAGPYWIGLSRAADGAWAWPDGHPARFARWCGGAPFDVPGETAALQGSFGAPAQGLCWSAAAPTEVRRALIEVALPRPDGPRLAVR